MFASTPALSLIRRVAAMTAERDMDLFYLGAEKTFVVKAKLDADIYLLLDDGWGNLSERVE